MYSIERIEELANGLAQHSEAAQMIRELLPDVKRYRWMKDNATRVCEPLYNAKTGELVANEVRAIWSFHAKDRPAFYADPDAAIDDCMKR